MSKQDPGPEDTPEEAQAKSKSIDERIPPVIPPRDEIGPGEEVLEQEAKAVRQQPQR